MSRNGRVLFAAVALMLVAAVLRFYGLGAKSLWLDEAYTIWMAAHPPATLWRQLAALDPHPPLYYGLLSVWQGVLGDGEVQVRALSALFGLLALPFFWGAARRLTDETTGVIALMILAVSPFHIQFAQEARMYSLLALAGAVMLYFLSVLLTYDATRVNRDPLQMIEPPAPRTPWIGLALALAAAMWTHNTAVIYFPLALNLAVLPLYWHQRRTGKPSAFSGINDPGFGFNWAVAQGLAFLVWVPWSLSFVRQALGVYRSFWLRSPDLQIIWDTVRNFNFAFLPDWLPFQAGWMGLYGGLALLGLVSLRRRRERAWLLAALLLVPVAIALAVSLLRPIFYDRTLIWITLPYYLLLAAGLRSLSLPRLDLREAFAPRPGKAMGERMAVSLQGLLVVLVVFLSAFSLYGYYFWFEKEEWDEAAAYVAQGATPTDPILFNASWVQIPFDYYYRHYQRPNPLRGLPEDLFDRGELEPPMTAQDLPRLRELVAGQPRVWLVYSHQWYADPDGLIPQEISRELQLAREEEFVGLQVLLYEAP